MSTSRPCLVVVVEDDDEMRQSMRRVLETEGFVTEVFSTAEAFLESGAASRARCLVLDIGLPGMSGTDLHRHLLRAGKAAPTVFVTAHETRGAGVCLRKPFPAETLIQAVNQSITHGGSR